MDTITENNIRSVFRFKVTIDFSGPGPITIRIVSVCAVKLSDALTFVYTHYDNVYSVEFLERFDCVLL